MKKDLKRHRALKTTGCPCFARGIRQFISTRLLRDAKRERAQVAMDFWKSRAASSTFLRSHREAHAKLDAVSSDLTLSETKVGLSE